MRHFDVWLSTLDRRAASSTPSSGWRSTHRGSIALLGAAACLVLLPGCGGGAASPSAPTASCAASALYGTQGERWSGSGRLLDYGFAGYRTGNEPIPTVAGPIVSVADFGAVAEDDGDDTRAFLDALAASPGGVVLIPAGRFVLTQRIEIRRSNIVLRGAGRDRTTLFFRSRSLDRQLHPGHGLG